MKNLKGILLAGGRGTRLYPLTALLNKQLQPVYDKPMVYYPLSTLMLAGIREILIISTPEDIPNFQKLLGDGSKWGISLAYAVQDEPRGIADSFLIGEDFIQKEAVCLILGDNLFYGYLDFLRDAINSNTGGTIFGYQVQNPQEYGVVDFDEVGNVLSIEEKPETPKSNYAIPGLYVYDSNVVEMVQQITPSARGELEITDLNKVYLSKKQLKVELIGRGIAWLDMGTPDSLLEAGEFIQLIEKRQGLKIGCLEEIAFSSDYIHAEQLENIIADTPNGPYKEYLKKIKLA